LRWIGGDWVMSKGAMAAKKRRREEARFLAELRVDGVVHRACKRAGLAVSTLYRWRDESSRFAKGWEAAKAQAAAALHAPAATPADVARPLARANSNWPKPFLRALAETSNVRAAAEQAGVDTLRVYRLRRDNPQFAADWRAALAEGYDHLEMETLAWLRGHCSLAHDPISSDPTQTGRPPLGNRPDRPHGPANRTIAMFRLARRLCSLQTHIRK
jgi:transposase-like protein